MMNKTMIKLLSLLLLTVLVLTACDVSAEPASVPETGETLENNEASTDPVEPKLENFFKISSEKSWDDLGKAKRYDGTLVAKSNDGRVIVLRTADVDLKNTVTETFTVYNTEMKKAVLTTTNTYQDGAYTDFDWNNLIVQDETVKYPETLIKVSVENVGVYFYGGYVDLPLIKVSSAKVTPVAEEIREENPDACVYEIALTHTFYDLAGKEIVTTRNDSVSWDYSVASESSFGVTIGSTLAIFDAETLQVISIVNGETDGVISGYDCENEKYGYFLSESLGFYRFPSIDFIEVYSKATGERILRYYLERNAQAQAYLLEGGDVLIQYSATIPEESNREPDYFIGETKVFLEHGILDVETGNYQPVELGFYIREFICSDLLEDYPFEGFEFTENVVNLALVAPIKDKKLENSEIRVLDNSCKEMFTMKQLVPEHQMSLYDSFGFEMLPNGDYLVDLVDVVRPQAIVTKEGTLRSYLPADAKIAGEYVVTSAGVFDYDMKCLYEFESNSYQLAFVLGEEIVVFEEFLDEAGATVTNYYRLTKGEDGFMTKDVFINLTVFSVEESYVILRNTETMKYSLYNAELKHVLTTQNEMTVYEIEGSYLIYTELEGHDLFYTVE